MSLPLGNWAPGSEEHAGALISHHSGEKGAMHGLYSQLCTGSRVELHLFVQATYSK